MQQLKKPIDCLRGNTFDYLLNTQLTLALCKRFECKSTQHEFQIKKHNKTVKIYHLIFLFLSSPAPQPVDDNDVELGVMPEREEENIYTEINDADCGIYELPRRNPSKRCC